MKVNVSTYGRLQTCLAQHNKISEVSLLVVEYFQKGVFAISVHIHDCKNGQII